MSNQATKIDVMNKTLMEIYHIQNLQQITISELATGIKENGYLQILPLLSITYDGGKTLALSNSDKYFNIFVKKVYEVYKKEKDKVVEDGTYDPFGFHKKIKIDTKTKTILELGNLIKLEPSYELYKPNTSYEESLTFQIDEVKTLLSIIKYHLKNLFDKTDRTLLFKENQIEGYRNNYSLPCNIDGIYTILLLTFNKLNNNNYYISVKVLDNSFEPMIMLITFNETSINVRTDIDSYHLISYNNYEIKNNAVEVTDEVIYKGIPISYKKYLLDETENKYPNLTNIDEPSEYTWFKLPWDALYGICNKSYPITDIESIDEIHNKYISVVSDLFMIKEYFSKTYHRKQSQVANASNITLEEIKKNIYGIPVDKDIYMIETSFQDETASSGYYQTYLSTKYYYHLSKGDINTISKNTLVSISKEDEILNKADLRNKRKTRKLIGGK